MSEAELHQIRVRLHQGERQKAARGELRLPLPAGLAHGAGSAIVLNPDEEVQARLRLVFGLLFQDSVRQAGVISVESWVATGHAAWGVIWVGERGVTSPSMVSGTSPAMPSTCM